MADSLIGLAFVRGRSMRRMLASAVILHAVMALGSPTFAAPGMGVTGNDTGGIMPRTPETARHYKQIAVAHCARWHRYAGISSIHHVAGDYIGFRCIYDRRYDPRRQRP